MDNNTIPINPLTDTKNFRNEEVLPINIGIGVGALTSLVPILSKQYNISEEDIKALDTNQFGKLLTKLINQQYTGPIGELLKSVRSTPSGTVIGGEPKDVIPPPPPLTTPIQDTQDTILSTPISTDTSKKNVGLPIPETQDKLKGFEKPQDVDTSVLMINKIPTWEKYFKNKEEFEKTAKENNITVEGLEQAAVEKQITFKRQGYDYDIYFDGKLIGQLNNATKASGGEVPRGKYGDAYNILFIDSSLNYEGVDTVDGLDYSKNKSKKMIAYGLLDKTYENSLANIFPNIKYDKKGKPIEYLADEKIEQEYLDKFINAVENKDYTTFSKLRNYDFEDSPLRSENFKNTLIEYTPKVVDFHRQAFIDKQKAIEETLNKPSNSVNNQTNKLLNKNDN